MTTEQRLRQRRTKSCGELRDGDSTGDSSSGEESGGAGQMKSHSSSTCPVCLEVPDVRYDMNCGHVGCGPCIASYMYSQQDRAHNAGCCPVCRERVRTVTCAQPNVIAVRVKYDKQLYKIQVKSFDGKVIMATLAQFFELKQKYMKIVAKGKQLNLTQLEDRAREAAQLLLLGSRDTEEFVQTEKVERRRACRRRAIAMVCWVWNTVLFVIKLVVTSLWSNPHREEGGNNGTPAAGAGASARTGAGAGTTPALGSPPGFGVGGDT